MTDDPRDDPARYLCSYGGCGNGATILVRVPDGRRIFVCAAHQAWAAPRSGDQGRTTPDVVNAERLALAAEVRRLRSDLVHARQWANLQRVLPGVSIDTEVMFAATTYCWEDWISRKPEHITASDGWQVGQEVPE